MDNAAAGYRRFLDGDDSGIVEVIRDTKDGLILFLFGYTHDLLLAEELMEDTFVRIVTKKPHFSEKSSFKTWLYAIGRNIALDYFRKNKNIVSEPPEFSEIPDDEAELEKNYLRSERNILLHRAMSRLSPDYRSVLYLTYFEGLSAQNTAKVMGKNRKQIENLLCRAKKALRKQLEKEKFVYEEL